MFGFLARPVLLALLLACTLPALAQVDVTPFTKLDTFTSIKLSPTGEYLAATVPRGDSTGLVVLRRANNAVTASVGLGKNTHVSDFEWVNDVRLVLAMAEAFGSDDDHLRMNLLHHLQDAGRRNSVPHKRLRPCTLLFRRLRQTSQVEQSRRLQRSKIAAVGRRDWRVGRRLDHVQNLQPGREDHRQLHSIQESPTSRLLKISRQ